MTMKSLNQALDIDLSQYVIVNFKTVADVVDAVGGITVDVQQYEINQLNKYTRQTAKISAKRIIILSKRRAYRRWKACRRFPTVVSVKGTGDDIKRTEKNAYGRFSGFPKKVKTMPFSDVKKSLTWLYRRSRPI